MAKRKVKGVSKLQMVREAVATLGKDATAKAIQEAVKSKHGVELPMKVAGSYKSLVLKKKKGRKKMGRPAKIAIAAAEAAVGAGAVAASAASNKGISLADIVAIKELAAKIGPAKFRELAAVLS